MDICKDKDYCGGCIYQGVPYEEQLAEKDRKVRRLIEDLDVYLEKYKDDLRLAGKGSFRAIDRYLGIEPTPCQYRYRNKMEYTFGDLVKDGPMQLGMHKKKNFMSIITVDQCQLVHEDFNKVLRATLDFCIEKEYRFCHKRTHQGLMRNLIVRRGVRTDELLVNIVTTTQSEFDEQGYVDMLRSLDLENELVGVLRTINDGIADAVNCDELRVLYGRDYYMEKIMGLDFKVSAFSFFQTNVEAAERLYEYAISLIDDYENKKVFDLYCGTGTITQALAKGGASEVTGVEIVEDAVESARKNAELNGLQNCSFIAGDVLKVLDELKEKPDVIVVDPPRVGIHKKALPKLLSYGVEQIVYVSCNPSSLIENLKQAAGYGYQVKSIKAFDNFGMTRHVETVVLMSQVKD